MPVFPKVKGDDSKPIKALDPETQDEILKRITQKDRDIIEILYETGLRPGEACYLRVKHVDLRGGVVSIEGTFSGTKERTTNKEKKKKQIPLSHRAWQIVVKNMESKHPENFLFINDYTGSHYTSNRLGKIWKKYSGIDDVKLYGASQHSFASQLVEKYDISLVGELMGHSDIRTTKKYLHARVAKLAAIVNDRRAIFSIVKPENRTGIEPDIYPSKTAFIQ
jgi:integrase